MKLWGNSQKHKDEEVLSNFKKDIKKMLKDLMMKFLNQWNNKFKEYKKCIFNKKIKINK